MSSKKHTNHIVTLLVLIVMISSVVGAVAEDFAAFGSKKTINVCACDMTEQTLTVQNTGQVTSTYMLEQSGKAGAWSSIAPQSFYLEPGQSQQIENFIKVPCSARGEYVLNTSVRTIFDLEKDLIQTVQVNNCPNVQIVSKFSGVHNECPCTPVQYDFEVINTGKHIETYQISVEPYSDAITLSTDFAILEPGQKEKISVFINLNCGEYGFKRFTLNALAQGTDILGQVDFDLNIDPCYDYNIDVGTEYSVCQGIPNVIDFSINNVADIANDYTVLALGPEWITPEEGDLFAWGGEQRNSEVLVQPPVEEESVYEFKLQTISARGEEVREVPITIISEKCYDYNVIGEGLTGIRGKTQTNVLTLQNIGSRETKYWIENGGPEWVYTQESSVVLNGGEQIDIPFEVSVPEDAEWDEYANTVYITIEDINETYSQQHNINIIPIEDAYLPDVETTIINTDYEGGEYEVYMTNVGHLWARYDLDIVGPEWVTINEDYMELGRTETGVFTLSIHPTNETAEDGYRVEVIAGVENDNIEYSTDILVNVVQPKSTWEKISDYLIYILVGMGLIIILIIILVAVLIIKKTKQKKPKKKTEKISDDKSEKEEKKIEKKKILINQKEYAKPKKTNDKKSVWPIILLIIIIVLALGAGSYFAFNKGAEMVGNESQVPELTEETTEEGVMPEVVPVAEEPQEKIQEKLIVEVESSETEEVDDGILTEDEVEESLIVLDRSHIPGKGNEFVLTNETEINLPMTIKNPTDRNAMFSADLPEDSWLEIDRERLTVKPESTETVNIKITPDHELLLDNDYSVSMNAKLSGKKINYEEEISFTITKKDNNWLIWLLGGVLGLITLGLIILIIALSKRPRKEKPAKIKKEKKTKKDAEPKKEKKVKKSKSKKAKKNDEGSVWSVVLIIFIAALIVGALAYWGWNNFTKIQDDSSLEEETDEKIVEEENEPVVEEMTEENEQEVENTEEAQKEPEAEEEPKLTEEDVQESLITIDRTGIEGSGNELKLENQNYSIPMSIKNPTDRTARFTVNTGNESWIRFDEYQILVEAESTKDTEMKIVPEYKLLQKNNYHVSVLTTLQGERIDYEEQLDFVLKENNGGWPWWVYVLIALVVLGLIIGLIEIFKNNKDKPKKNKKKTKSAKKTTKKKKAKKSKAKKMNEIDRKIEKIRKRTVLKIKNS